MLSTRRDFLQSLTSLIGSSVLLNDNLFANLLSEDKIIDPKILAKKYLIKKGSIYLNHAAIGTVPKLIHEAHVKYLETVSYTHLTLPTILLV